MTKAETGGGILLAACSEHGAWLVEGEDHINALLAGDGGYPVPVTRIRFDDAEALAAYLAPRGLPLSALWTIHGDIITRLQAAGELRELAPPAAATKG